MRRTADGVSTDLLNTPLGSEHDAVQPSPGIHSNIKLREIAAAITDRSNDPGIADLTADGKITEILADLTHPSNPTPPMAIETDETCQTVTAESGERLSA